MGETTRSVKINKENDNSFVIIQNIVEKVNAEELKNIYNKIKADEITLNRSLENIPKQAEKQLNDVKKNLEMVKADIEAVGKYAEKMVKSETDDKEVKA
jgi:DNA relaxase NicK